MEIMIYIWMIIVIIGFSVLFGYFAYNMLGWRFVDQYNDYKRFKKKMERKEEKESNKADGIIDILEYNRRIQLKKIDDEYTEIANRKDVGYHGIDVMHYSAPF